MCVVTRESFVQRVCNRVEDDTFCRLILSVYGCKMILKKNINQQGRKAQTTNDMMKLSGKNCEIWQVKQMIFTVAVST